MIEYVQAVVVSSMSFANILANYQDISSLAATQYPCYMCPKNSSCE